MKKLAYKGLNRREIGEKLGVKYGTVDVDLKLMGIIPVTNQTKENV